jgi:quinol monooxygenase YgiN
MAAAGVEMRGEAVAASSEQAAAEPSSGNRIVRIAELEIDPDRLERFKALLAEEIEASVRVEPGVTMLHVVSLRERPEQIRILEVYADQAAYEAHLLTPHFQRYKTLTRDMVRSLRLLDVDPIRLGATAAT